MSYESDSDEPEDDKMALVCGTPPVAGGVGEDEPVPAGLRAGKGCEIPNFKGSYLCLLYTSPSPRDS